MKPIAAITRGLAAGALGTLAMDLVWYARYRRGGGDSSFADWEVTSDITGWDEVPAPGQVGRKAIVAVTGRDVPVEHAALVSNVMHWIYGSSWTALYGLLGARGRRWWSGPAFGSLVWSSSYVVLPVVGVYEPIWHYDAKTLLKDWSAHLVFGTTADAGLRALG